jgi:CubicO group peptidase (beta-lactamase class C family)
MRLRLLPMLLWPLSSGAEVWPDPDWPTKTPQAAGIDVALLEQARDYALTGSGSGYVIHDGHLVFSWGDPAFRYDVLSVTKSIGVTALGLAVADGLVTLGDLADDNHVDFANPPISNQQTGWIPGVSLQHLALHTAGFDKDGGYTAFQFQPGSAWLYSDGGSNWLAEVLTLAYGEDLLTLLRDRVFEPLGIGESDLVWRDNDYRPDLIQGIKRRELGAGISLNVDALARIGLLYLRRGLWQQDQLLPTGFVGLLGRAHPASFGLPSVDPVGFPGAPNHYSLLWWNNADSTLPAVPKDAYWAWGAGDNLLVVVPSLDLVVARTGNGWSGSWNGDYSRLAPFLNPIVAAMPEPAGPASVNSLSAASLALLMLTLLVVGAVLQRSIKTPRLG